MLAVENRPRLSKTTGLYNVHYWTVTGWKSEELGELLGLEPVSLMIKKSRLRWFGHVERKD